MKRTLQVLMGLITGILLCFTTSSCSKEEMNEKNLEGKWQSTSVRSQGFDAGKLVYDETSNCVDWYLGFNIKSDGTGQLISYEEGESSISQMTWVLMDNRLIITIESDGESGSMTFDIVEIKSKSMILSETDEYVENGIQCKDVATYTFKKI